MLSAGELKGSGIETSLCLGLLGTHPSFSLVFPGKRRGGSGEGAVMPFASEGTFASDPAIQFVSKISGRPCVGGNPGRAAHQRIPSEAVRLRASPS
jgi:hypothetical protein